jgi:hypothetical protein
VDRTWVVEHVGSHVCRDEIIENIGVTGERDWPNGQGGPLAIFRGKKFAELCGRLDGQSDCRLTVGLVGCDQRGLTPEGVSHSVAYATESV